MFKFKQYVEDVENFELEEDDEQSEAAKTLSFATRAKMRRNAIKYRNRRKIGAKIQKKKIASVGRLKKRARRAARRAFTKKAGGGSAPTSVGQKNVIKKRLATTSFQSRMGRTAKLGVKTARKRDMARKQGGAGKRRTG
tara:strand:- start:1420 stop:1836 length:417 start_codon:yes stop_codon:yes gene_type:complete